MRPNRRKRNWFIEKDFQYAFTIKICLFSGVVSAIGTGLALFFVRVSYDMLIQSAAVQLPSQVPRLRSEFFTVLLALIVAWLAYMIVMFILGIALSHKVAGPVMALRRRLQDFGSGQKEVRLRLRETDSLKDMEHVFNSAMEAHETRNKNEKDQLHRISDLVNSGRKEDALEELKKVLDKK